MPPKTFAMVVAEQFPDLNAEEAKQLSLSALNLVKLLGNALSKKLEQTHNNGEPTRQTIIDRRAQAVALALLSKSMFVKQDEDDHLTTVRDLYDAITGAANGT